MTMTEDAFTTVMLANVMGPCWTIQQFMPYLERSQKPVVLNMTSGMGSIGRDMGDRLATYSLSKNAVNMLVRVESSRPCVDSTTFG